MSKRTLVLSSRSSPFYRGVIDTERLMRRWIGGMMGLTALWIALPALSEIPPLTAHDAAHATSTASDMSVRQPPQPRSAKKSGAPHVFMRQLQHAMSLGDQGDEREASIALEAVIAHPAFGMLSKGEQQDVYSRAGWIAIRHGDIEQAKESLLKATKDGSDNPDDWYFLALVESDLENPQDAARYLLHFAEGWPHLLANLHAGAVFDIARGAPDGSSLRFNLLRALSDAGWDNRGLGVGDLWYDLALLYLSHGDSAGVQAAIQRSSAPEALAKFHADRRFDAWIDHETSEQDVERATIARVATLRQLALEHPDDLEVRMELGYSLLSLGRHEDVIALADQTLASIHAATPGQSAFRNMQYQPWILDNRATALVRLGRWDEAIADLKSATGMEEQGQAINLAQLLCHLGRPDEAEKALAAPDMITRHGEVSMTGVRHCIAMQKGDRAAAKTAFSYLRKHENRSTSGWIRTLLLAGKPELAARDLQRALENPLTRGAMLSSLQQYRQRDPLPGELPIRKSWRELLDRPNIKRAVDKVGRINQYNLYRMYGN